MWKAFWRVSVKIRVKYLEVGTNRESFAGKYSTLSWKGCREHSRGVSKRSLLSESPLTIAISWRLGPIRNKVPHSQLFPCRSLVSSGFALRFPLDEKLHFSF